MISYKVFMSFVDEGGEARRLQSKECYDTWVMTRRSPPKQPEESFRRVLTAHVCGVDGRRPFPPAVEASLLKVLRKKEVWECFRGTDVSIGIRGFRNQGYHEARRMNGCANDKPRSRKRDVQEAESHKKSRNDYIDPSAANIIAQQQQQIQQQLQQLQQMQLQQQIMQSNLSSIMPQQFYTIPPNQQVVTQSIMPLQNTAPVGQYINPSNQPGKVISQPPKYVSYNSVPIDQYYVPNTQHYGQLQ